MKENFKPSLAAVLVHEGGYVNDPRDNGGATNKGVTQAVYDDWRTKHGLPHQSVKAITANEIEQIYKGGYWDAIRGDDLPLGLDYAMFDFAVNSGGNRASRYLQSCVGVTTDGKIGPATLGAIHNVMATIGALCDKRLEFMRGLADFDHFGRGWTARVNEVAARAKGMAK
jgi:lysozyme family protein